MQTITTNAAAQVLHLGCGRRHHPRCVNLDLAPADPSVRRWDVTQGLPFADGAFDAVYHSHLLEHLPRPNVLPFLRECLRVLRRDGTVRVAVPDLEAIARLYLDAIDDAWAGDPAALEEHHWLVLELYDQTTREAPGGAMARYVEHTDNPLAWRRLGDDANALRQSPPASASPYTARWRDRVRGWLFGSWRERLLRWLLRDEYSLLTLGRFRRAGEVHHWMYDRVSLRSALMDAGFVDFRVVAADESAISNWNAYYLDITSGGVVRKPDSLYVEARKP